MPSIIFLGEAPGKDEDEVGQPFVGRSGKLLDQWLDFWQLKPDDYAILNTVKCFPQNDEGKPRPPTEKEKDEWRPWLLKQLLALKPKLIITLGATALNEMTNNNSPILEACCNQLALREFYTGINCMVYGLPHPAFFLRGSANLETGNDHKKNRFTRSANLVIHEALKRPRVLIFDIETDSLDVNTAKVKLFGAYSYSDGDGGHMVSTYADIQNLIDTHTHLVGFNIREFDIPILENNGINMRNKVVVDLYQGLRARGRKDVMGLKDLRDNKLATIVKFLNLGEKSDIDYETIKSFPHVPLETFNKVIDYARNDVKITKALYDWWLDWAAPFEQYVSPRNQWRKTYMTCSVASYSYKAICYATGRPEEYNDDAEKLEEGGEDETFTGGFVSADIEVAHDNILYFDFASLYPHNFIQGNLFSPVSPDYKGTAFVANDFYPNLRGAYKADAPGDVEIVLKKFYLERKKYKKAKDPREYALKILLNSAYGASSSETFKSIHNPTIGPDTCYIGQQNIKYVRKKFLEEGFVLCMTDTDSCMVQVPPGKTEKDALRIVKECASEIKKWLPFPADTFNMELQAKIKYFQMFRHKKTQELLKKFYLYVTEDGKVVVKGLPIVKSNSTQLSKRVFEILEPQIAKRGNCRFSEGYIDKLMYKLVGTDVSLAAKQFKVKSPGDYKNPSQLDCQIAQRYGPGSHWLLRNKVIGAGKDVKYGKLEELRNVGLEFIDFTLTKEELHYFVGAGLEAFYVETK